MSLAGADHPPREMKRILLEKLGYHCWGCGFQPPSNDERYFQFDHRESRWASGSNELPNRAILCQPCNMEKLHKMTLQELRGRNTTLGRIYAPLVSLALASTVAQEEYDKWVRQLRGRNTTLGRIYAPLVSLALASTVAQEEYDKWVRQG